jgi:predicted translin family RNA/ssDNA-binding protein
MLKLSDKKKAYLELSTRLTELCDLLVKTVDTRNEDLAKVVVKEMDKGIKHIKKVVAEYNV